MEGEGEWEGDVMHLYLDGMSRYYGCLSQYVCTQSTRYLYSRVQENKRDVTIRKRNYESYS